MNANEHVIMYEGRSFYCIFLTYSDIIDSTQPTQRTLINLSDLINVMLINVEHIS